MSSFRGVDQAAIIKSLNDFFDFLLARNIGPLTAAAIATWREPGGMLAQIAQAKSPAEIESAIRGGKEFPRWMDSYFSSLLPAMELKWSQKTDDSTALMDRLRLRAVTQPVADWGGFSLLSVRYHVMTSEDHEILRYSQDVLKCTDNEIFVRFNPGTFKGPFENFKLLYNYAPDGTRADFNRAAQSLRDLAVAWGMEDHVSYISADDKELIVVVTPKLAQAFADRAAAEIADKTLLPVGISGRNGFIPVKPAQP